MECQTRYLAAHRVKARQHDCLGGIVHDNLYARRGLKSADVATLAADDAALDLVVVDMEHCHRVLDGSFCGHTLNRLYNDALCLFCCGHLGIVHDVVDVTCGCGLCLILERLHEFLLGFLSRETGDFHQFLLSLAVKMLDFRIAALKNLLAVVEVVLDGFEFLLAARLFSLLLIELELTLFETGLVGLGFLHTLVGRTLGIADYLHLFLFCLEDF